MFTALNEFFGKLWCKKFGHPKSRKRGFKFGPGVLGPNAPGATKDWCGCCGAVLYDGPQQSTSKIIDARSGEEVFFGKPFDFDVPLGIATLTRFGEEIHRPDGSEGVYGFFQTSRGEEKVPLRRIVLNGEEVLLVPT